MDWIWEGKQDMATAPKADTVTGLPLCARGLHTMTPDNRHKGTDRCVECKRLNDRVLYDRKKAAKNGTPLTEAEVGALRAAASVKVGAAVTRKRVPASQQLPARPGSAITRASAMTAVMDGP